MKLFTINLLKFSIVALLLTVAFRFVLSFSLEKGSPLPVIVTAVLYAVGMFTSGWIFGKKDYIELPLFDIGFRFHLMTYLICNGIGELYFLAGLQSSYEKVSSVHTTAWIWGLFFLIYFIIYVISRTKSILGIDKYDIFD